MKLPSDFKDLLEEFAREKVECVVIGGYAFAFHVEPRATKDLDVLLEGSPENRERAATALARYGAPQNVVEATRGLAEDEVAYLGRPPLRIDLLRTIDGVNAADVIRNAVAADWDGTRVRVIALDDLIVNKRAAGRPQDIADVAKLERVRARARLPR
ncbi:MAG TPA: nucleotidyltransferase [Polyangiaceae bacterium]|jgi:predicted nucleotidyltransferase|nr:nucleotidyltransferase [Polyangiaceae bacterium]